MSESDSSDAEIEIKEEFEPILNKRNAIEEKRMEMPVILPVEDIPKRTRRKYTTSEHVINKNRRVAKDNKKRFAENKIKLQEYEILKQKKQLTKEDAEQLFESIAEKTILKKVQDNIDEKFSKIEKIMSESKKTQVPKLESIKEDPYESGYSSTDSVKRTSDRFKRIDTSPSLDRFRKKW